MGNFFLAFRQLLSHHVLIWPFFGACATLVSLTTLMSTSVLLDLTLITSLKAPSANTVTLRIRASTYEFWGDTIQSITLIIYSLLEFLGFFCVHPPFTS